MKTASTALQTYLANLSTGAVGGEIFGLVDLYTITHVTGTVLRYAAYQYNLTVGGNVFTALGPFVERSKVKQTLGMEVSSIEMTIIADPTHQIGTTPILQTIAQGLWDGAIIRIDRLFMASPNDTSMGTIIWFVGTIAEIRELDRIHAVFTVKDKRELLNVPFPRNLYQPGCRHTLYDAGCLVVKSSFTATGTVSAGATATTIPTNLTQSGSIAAPAAPTLSYTTPGGINLPATAYSAVVTYVTALGETGQSLESFISVPVNSLVVITSPSAATGATGWNAYIGLGSGGEMKQNGAAIAIGTNFTESVNGLVQGIPPPIMPSDGYYTKGVITFTSGANNGLSRRINLYTTGVVQVSPGFPTAPATGDTFSIVPGCDKTASTCNGKFSNLIHFGGQPYVPQPEVGI